MTSIRERREEFERQMIAHRAKERSAKATISKGERLMELIGGLIGFCILAAIIFLLSVFISIDPAIRGYKCDVHIVFTEVCIDFHTELLPDFFPYSTDHLP
jgi:hypothetical protein